MSIEFQIRSFILASIITRSVQQQLREACFAEVLGFYIDHADVAPVAPGFSSANGAVDIRVPVDIYVVKRDAVFAAPNGVPDGATTPMGRIEFILEMKVNGTNVSLSCIDVDLGPLGGVPGGQVSALKAQILASFHAQAPFSLGAMLDQLGAPSPTTSSVELAGETVCIRFDATGGPTERLFADQEWGVFIEGSAVERLASSSVPNNLPSAITSMRLTPHWRPSGTTPHVDIDYDGAAQVPDPLAAHISGTFSSDLTMIPTPAQTLRTNVSWTIKVDLGAAMPAFVDNMVKTLIAAALDPKKFGGTPTGPRSFFIEKRLPDIEFSGSRLTYTSVQASPAGMTIGGPVRFLEEPSRDPLKTSVTSFSHPAFVVFASRYGCIFGWAGETPSADSIRVHASVGLDTAGKFCEYEVISPGDWIEKYITQNLVTQEIFSFVISVPALTAVQITEPVRLLVHTSRGVRLIDFGKPDVKVDQNGNILNAEGSYIDDCLYMTIYDWYWATLPVDPVTGRPLPPPPKPWPPPDWDGSNLDWSISPPDADQWSAYIGSLKSLNIQIVTVTGLEPGELIQFQSFEHSANITADSAGRAVVPVVLAYRNRLEPAKLTRVNRQSFKGNVTVRTAVFERHLQLQAGQRNQVITASDGLTYVIAESADETFAYRPGVLGVWSRLDVTEIPQKDSVSQASAGESYQLPGLVSTIRLPGFPDEPIALAIMDDDSILILDVTEENQARVAGTFTGPIGEIAVAEEWGIVAGRNRITALMVTRSETFAGPSKNGTNLPKH